jgi:hypothetical protein
LTTQREASSNKRVGGGSGTLPLPVQGMLRCARPMDRPMEELWSGAQVCKAYSAAGPREQCPLMKGSAMPISVMAGR